MRTPVLKALGAVAVCGFALAVGSLLTSEPGSGRSRKPVAATDTAFYVWQQAWNAEVEQAVSRSSKSADRFMVLASTFQIRSGRVEETPVRVRWHALAEAGIPVAPVVRLGADLAPVLAGPDRSAVAEPLSLAFGRFLEKAENRGVPVPDVQIDYDCPTSKLSDYAALVSELGERLPDRRVSITALPTWLEDRGFESLAREVEYFVLQVHSFERPRNPDDPPVLCDTGRIPDWLRRADRVGIPYYLALPTYGYHVIFGPDGEFAGLVAEGEAIPLAVDGPRVRTVESDPVEMAAVVRDLNKNPPRFCRGIAWFRLPVHGDRMNWSWKTLVAVMEGREPEIAFRPEVRSPSPGLTEIWIANTGERNVRSRVRMPLKWGSDPVLAYDVLNGFQEGPYGSLTGPAPAPDLPVLAAWYRTKPGQPGSSEFHPLGEIEVLP